MSRVVGGAADGQPSRGCRGRAASSAQEPCGSSPVWWVWVGVSASAHVHACMPVSAAEGVCVLVCTCVFGGVYRQSWVCNGLREKKGRWRAADRS